jgi:hypothetical protein
LFSTNYKPPFQGPQGRSETRDFLQRGKAFFGTRFFLLRRKEKQRGGKEEREKGEKEGRQVMG